MDFGNATDSELLFLNLDKNILSCLKIYSSLSFLPISFSFKFYIVNYLNSFCDSFCDISTNILSHPECIKVNDTMEYYQLDEVIFRSNYEGFQNYYKSSYNSSHVRMDYFDQFSTSSQLGGLFPNDTIGHFNISELTRGASRPPLEFFGWQMKAIIWASQQPFCVWPLANLAICLMILLLHSLLKAIFGNLRASEEENMKDQFWNLVFYKIVFVFGVVNVQEFEDAVGWCLFVIIVGFLQLARQLCQERHNYLIVMNDWTRRNESRRNRILGLLSFIFITSIILFFVVGGWFFGSSPVNNEFTDPLNFRFNSNYYNNQVSFAPKTLLERSESSYDFNLGLHSALFMLCELGLLIIQTLHALTICIFDQVRTRCYKGRQMSEDTYSNITQTINFKFDLVSLLFDLVHHVHMLVCCNLFLSMTSLIVSLQMRTRVRQIHGVLKKRQSYLWLTEHLDQYPDIISLPNSEGEDENCAICWDTLVSQKAKALPCNHIFHTSCIRKWLLVSMNCPTCRLSLVNEKEAQFCSMERTPRRIYTPRPIGLLGFLQTGQALLDLFGGWDPQFDEAYEVYDEAPPIPRPVPLFSDFGAQDWNAQQPPSPETPSRRETSSQTDTQTKN